LKTKRGRVDKASDEGAILQIVRTNLESVLGYTVYCYSNKLMLQRRHASVTLDSTVRPRKKVIEKRLK
jgi:hypothetical protein